MRINNNLMAMNTHRQLGLGGAAGAKSMERLSSGYRINRAGDDAAGLSISEKMRGQIRGLNQASRNAQDGISMIQTAEGALNETHAILQRMRELVVQSNNDTNTIGDKEAIQKEVEQLSTEVTEIANRTEFNGKTLLKGTIGLKLDSSNDGTLDVVLSGHVVDVSQAEAAKTYTFSYTNNTNTISLSDGSTSQTLTLSGMNGAYSAGEVLDFNKLGVKITLGSADTFGSDGGEINIHGSTLRTEVDSAISSKSSIQIGANISQTLDISIGDMRATALGSAATPTFALSGVHVLNETFSDNLAVIDQSIADVSAERAKLGAYQNRLDHTIKNLDTSAENLQASESRIRDVDMAKEMMEFTKNNILQQAAQAMLAQANQAPQGVLQLLR